VQGFKTTVGLHLFLELLNIHLHAPLRQVPIRNMQDVLVALQYEETSSHSINKMSFS